MLVQINLKGIPREVWLVQIAVCLLEDCVWSPAGLFSGHLCTAILRRYGAEVVGTCRRQRSAESVLDRFRLVSWELR